MQFLVFFQRIRTFYVFILCALIGSNFAAFSLGRDSNPPESNHELTTVINNKSERISALTTLNQSLTSFLADYQTDNYCENDPTVYTSYQLGLKPDSRNHKIETSEIGNQLLGDVSEDYTFSELRFSFADEKGESNIDAVQKVNIKQNNSHVELSVNSEEAIDSFQVDFIAIFTRKNEKFNDECVINVRLHFAEKFVSTTHKISAAIGRNGLHYGTFSLPYGTEFYNGQFWTTDCSNENITSFTQDGRLVSAFGSFGKELGKLDTPSDMKIRNDKIYVVEERNHRVQIFDLDGNYLNHIGNSIALLSEFETPLGIAIGTNEILITDYGNNRIKIYDTNWNLKHTVTNNNITDGFELGDPYYAEYIPSQNLFIVNNRGRDEILLMRPDGSITRSLGVGMLDWPHEVAIDAHDNIFVADMYNNRIVTFKSQHNFEVVQNIEFPIEYGMPKTIAVNDQGQIAVGFVGNAQAYFLIIQPLENQNEMKVDAQNNNFLVPGLNLTNASSQEGAKGYNTYVENCMSCHETGRFDAPARGNIESWEKFPRDMDILLSSLKKGEGGAMLRNGGCEHCTEEELIEAINFMLPMTWDVQTIN